LTGIPLSGNTAIPSNPGRTPSRTGNQWQAQEKLVMFAKRGKILMCAGQVTFGF